MSKKKLEDLTENYTFLFRDGFLITFPLKKSEFLIVQDSIFRKVDTVLLENYVINIVDLRYVAKQEQKTQKEEPFSAIPEHMEQDVYEYLKNYERGVKFGEIQ